MARFIIEVKDLTEVQIKNLMFDFVKQQKEIFREATIECIENDVEKVSSENILGNNSINGIKLNEKIRNEELFEYQIRDREDFIENLYSWIAEAKGNDKILMKEDLQELLGVEDNYIFSSINTNHYIYVGCSDFDETCKELLALNETIA